MATKKSSTPKKRPSYWAGVEWIAFNDDPQEMDLESISGTISVGLLADLFGKDSVVVAFDVRRMREREAKKERTT